MAVYGWIRASIIDIVHGREKREDSQFVRWYLGASKTKKSDQYAPPPGRGGAPRALTPLIPCLRHTEPYKL